MSEEQWDTVIVTYMGRRYNGTKIHHFFLNPDGSNTAYSRAPKFPIVGNTYEMEVLDKRAKVQSAKRVGQQPTSALTNQWTLYDKAAYAEKVQDDATKRLKKAEGDNIGHMTLNELRTYYRHAAPTNRAAMLTVFNSYLIGGM